MNRRRFIRNLGAGAAVLTFGALPKHLLAKNDFVTISILHTNDIHSHIEPFSGSNQYYNGKGGVARIAEIADNHRKLNPNTLLFDAGDMFQGTPYFNYFKGELILKVMGAAGYDAGTIGNHEFDNGLTGIANALPNGSFPLVISNYDFSDTVLNGKLPKWKVFKRDGVRIGVYGMGIKLEGLVDKKNFGNTRYENPVVVAKKMETFLKKEKDCDLIVCLSHLGLKYSENRISDLALAPETRYTDLILGGHTHTFLDDPLRVKNKNGQEIIVNQAGWGGLVVGKIDFILERNRGDKTTVLAEKIS